MMGTFQIKPCSSADAWCPTQVLLQLLFVHSSLLSLLLFLSLLFTLPQTLSSHFSLPVSLICKPLSLPQPSWMMPFPRPLSIPPAHSPQCPMAKPLLMLFARVFWSLLLVTVGGGISTSKPVSVPEMQQFIYNTSFVRDLSVKPILCLLSLDSSETDRQTSCML